MTIINDDDTCSTCINKGTVGSAFELEGGTLVEDGTFYEGVDDFCYLGDRISAGGGADAAVLARIRSGWAKFNELTQLFVALLCQINLKVRYIQHVLGV